ncbi:hypothetical protein VNI00_008993 [Paramarasmius palmivorus]|uniref:F-box domain-containing protein n=1 Tax=Paramarasmius palmivorus TaxID=297713 RepID=A0AAW0CRC4_9AGAR
MDESGLDKLSKEYMDSLFRLTFTEHHQKHVSQFISSTEQKCNALGLEIDKLKVEIVRREHQRKGLEKDMERYGTLLKSPVRRMPPEILGLIFAIVCEDNNVGPYQLPQAVVLSHVCRRWRQVVAETPRTWSSMTIPFDEWEEKEDDCCLPVIIQLFLERSKASPLILMLEFEYDSDFDLDRNCQVDAVDLLIKESHRWERFDIQAGGYHTTHPIFEHLFGNLPILKHVGISGLDSLEVAEGFTYLQQAPSLRSVAIKSSFYASEVSLPHSMITTLKWERLDLSVLPLLSSYSNLEDLHVSQLADEDDSDIGIEVSDTLVSCNTLRRLAIDTAIQADVFYLLTHSIFSSLCSLEISGVFETPGKRWPSWNNDTLIEFLRRSSCPITTLSLKWLPITEEQAIGILRFLPTIKTLFLEEFRRGNDSRAPAQNRFITNNFFAKCLHFIAHTNLASPHPPQARISHTRARRRRYHGSFDVQITPRVSGKWGCLSFLHLTEPHCQCPTSPRMEVGC